MGEIKSIEDMREEEMEERGRKKRRLANLDRTPELGKKEAINYQFNDSNGESQDFGINSDFLSEKRATLNGLR